MPEYQTTDLVITIKFNSGLDTEENGPKYTYNAEVTYATVKDAVEKASKFTGWALQRRARKGELPRDGRIIKVNGDGEYQKSLQEQIADMSADERMRLFLELQAQMQAAATVEMTKGTPDESNDSEELTEEELEQATAPVPEPKADDKKSSGRKK